MRDSGALNRGVVARLFGVDEGRVTDFVVFEPATQSLVTRREAMSREVFLKRDRPFRAALAKLL